MKKLLILFLLVAAPVSAQVPGGDFHAWFLSQVAGKPFTQQTLVELQPALACVGSQLTPANANGEQTKIYDPTSERWTRVGFGEGHWVWMVQGPGEAAASSGIPCGTAPAPPVVVNPPVVTPPASADFQAALDKAKGELLKEIGKLSDQVAAHDDKQNQILAFFTNAKTIIGEVGILVGYLIEHYRQQQ